MKCILASVISTASSADGLPTLKVQTLDERSIASGERVLGSRRRARTLPSVRTRARCVGATADVASFRKSVAATACYSKQLSTDGQVVAITLGWGYPESCYCLP